jgi:hypothetical protein
MIAASLAQHRLGIISAFINPETVSCVNAFALGALSQKPSLVVEVRHIGFWYDNNTTRTYTYTNKSGFTNSYFREEYLAALMMDSGCEVIAHLSNTQRSVALIDAVNMQGKKSPPYSFANDNQLAWQDSQMLPIKSCVGSIYENWAPLYQDLFESVHRGTFDASRPLYYDFDGTSNSPGGVSLNPQGPADMVAASGIMANLERQGLIGKALRAYIFQGPYTVTGQRDANMDGIPDPVQTVGSSDKDKFQPAEFGSMCWYVKGVVEKTVLSMPSSPDRDALVPGGLDPAGGGKIVPYPRADDPSKDVLVLPSGLSGQCLQNISSKL